MAAPKGNKNAVGNKGGGRKSEYKNSYSNMVYQLTMLGATDQQLAEFFEVSETTINAWKKIEIEFSAALKKGKQIADAQVAMRLYKRAMGYKYDEVSFEKIVPDIDDNTNIKVSAYKKKVVTKEVAPDVTAQIFWLKNRQKENWKDRQHNSIDIDFEKLSDEDLDRLTKHVLETSKYNNG